MPQYATVYNPTTGQRKRVLIGDPNAFAGGFRLETAAPSTAPASTPQSRLEELVQELLPDLVPESELSTRFGQLYDPTYNYETSELERELGRRRSRFGQDEALSAERLGRNRALTEGAFREQLAAGGAGGQLAQQQLGRQLQPYTDQSQDARIFSRRFGEDISEEEKQRRRAINQRRATARQQYLTDPANRYEFSY